MTLTQLQVLRCHANCTRCGLPTEFAQFESGPGGDFATFVGERTGALYRLALGAVHYAHESLDNLLAPAIEREGSREMLRRIPESIRCKICGNVFRGQSMPIDREELVSAYDL
jgi:hypothetical protein